MSSKRPTKQDKDFLFLEQVLDKFYDLDNGTGSKKLKSNKKKRRKHEGELEEDTEESTGAGNRSSITDNHRAPPAGALQQQHTKTEHAGTTAQRGNKVEVVTFQDPRKRPKTSQRTAVEATPTPTTTQKKKNDQIQEELSLEKARLEVHRFGITGYKKEEQRGFEQDRAIMLGARPPKKPYVNYRVLQQQIREKKQKVKEEVELEPELKKKKKQKKPRDQKTTSSGSGSAPTGQMGRFKNGMLILSPKEIQTIKGSKRKK
ncbi:40S small subunit processome assembly factor 1 isoform X2 [Cynoglossus semilaevis]|uniref:40S small subunit processome assembly factor 1 isoform X2 n=1 Tax=Cynoglossus semilaevis TaxID=244447 RepID=UPI0007DCA2FD|nr:uncharacterized protein C1orf131 homolog isoform X2 [Cynoglossus semilaevis]